MNESPRFVVSTRGDCFSYTTMKNKSYSDKLKDPRWQKKRLDIFNRDDWKCRCCYATNTALNAHHLYYVKGNRPWEYDDDAIVTVCNPCHGILHKELNKLSGIIAFEILSGKTSILDFSKYFQKE